MATVVPDGPAVRFRTRLARSRRRRGHGECLTPPHYLNRSAGRPRAPLGKSEDCSQQLYDDVALKSVVAGCRAEEP